MSNEPVQISLQKVGADGAYLRIGAGDANGYPDGFMSVSTYLHERNLKDLAGRISLRISKLEGTLPVGGTDFNPVPFALIEDGNEDLPILAVDLSVATVLCGEIRSFIRKHFEGGTEEELCRGL